jgi:hypothetical protein
MGHSVNSWVPKLANPSSLATPDQRETSDRGVVFRPLHSVSVRRARGMTSRPGPMFRCLVQSTIVSSPTNAISSAGIESLPSPTRR